MHAHDEEDVVTMGEGLDDTEAVLWEEHMRNGEPLHWPETKHAEFAELLGVPQHVLT